MKKGLKLDGKKVQSLRQRNNWTQTQLGTDIMRQNDLKKLSLRTIQRIEKDPKYFCSTTTIKQLAKVFKVKVEDLIHISEKTNTKKVVTETEKTETTTTDKSNVKDNEELKIDFNPNTGFCLDEFEIRYIEDCLIGDPFKRWMPEESAWELSNVLRKKYKFQNTSFKTLMNETNITKEMYEIFYTAQYRNIASNGYIKCHGKKIRRLSSMENFLENLDTAHRYAIDCDIPRDKEILTTVSDLIEAIEDYIEPRNEGRGYTSSRMIINKFNLANKIKPFLDAENRMSIFCDHFKWVYLEFDPKMMINRWREASVVRICIKNWENPDVLSLDYYCGKELKESSTMEIFWNPPDYIDPPVSDTNETEQNITDEQPKDDIPF